METHCLSERDFARIFGINENELPDECKKLINTVDFSYRIVKGKDREKLLLKAIKVLNDNLSVSGSHRKIEWEKGWKENLDNFIESNFDSQKLIPKFVKENQPIRFNGEYISPMNPEFETAFVKVLRCFLFKKYFASSEAIYEFGCGTGHNLLELAKLYPNKHIVGLDWSIASCNLVELIAKKYGLNLESRFFDIFSPDYNIEIIPQSAVLTIGTMEQIGTRFNLFLDFLIKNKISLCINVETIYELYDQESIFDYIAAKYLEKRGYLRGYLNRLKQLEEDNIIKIIDVRKTFGSFFHDGYNFIIWQPI